jgi:hypothetical protein
METFSQGQRMEGEMGDVGGKGGGLNYEGNAKGNKNDRQKKFVI